MVYDTRAQAVLRSGEKRASAACLLPRYHFLNFLEAQKWSPSKRGKASAGQGKQVGDMSSCQQSCSKTNTWANFWTLLNTQLWSNDDLGNYAPLKFLCSFSGINCGVMVVGVWARGVSSAMTYLCHHARASWQEDFWRTHDHPFLGVCTLELSLKF